MARRPRIWLLFAMLLSMLNLLAPAAGAAGESVQLTAPTTGTTLVAGESARIQWLVSGNVQGLYLYYMSSDRPNFWWRIPTGKCIPAKDTAFLWAPPGPAGTRVKLRAIAVNDCAREPVANPGAAVATFTTDYMNVVAPAVVLDFPNGGETLAHGSTVELRWHTREGLAVEKVALEYTLNGADWVLIARDLPNNGSYSWTAPADTALVRKLWVRVLAYPPGNPQPLKAESQPLKLANPRYEYVYLVDPDPGHDGLIELIQAQTYPIKFRTSPLIKSVRIAYSFGTIADCVNLSDLTRAADGITYAYPWHAPALDKDQVRVQIFGSIEKCSPNWSVFTTQDGKPVVDESSHGFVMIASPHNRAPLVAVAANPPAALETEPVTLDATGTLDPDGDKIAFKWTQVAGAPVKLSSTTSANPFFLAPLSATGARQFFRFRVEASDGTLSSSAEVSVQVDPKPMCEPRFVDVGPSNPACTAISLLAGRKVIGGFPDGTFRPDRGVTRAEFAKMLVVARGWKLDPGGAVSFSDSREHWSVSLGYVQAAVANGAIAGFQDGTFRPDDPVTRAQVIKIAAAAVGLPPGGDGAPYGDVFPDAWFHGWVQAAYRDRLIGDGLYAPVWTGTLLDPNRPATRGEAALVLANMVKWAER